MRPSIRRMFDSQIRIWRSTVTKDSVGVETRDYTPIAIVDCTVNRSRTGEGNQSSAGLAPVGALRWYGLPTIDVQPRDLCEVIAGPDAGHTWEVNAPPVRPRNHHTQVDCIEWNGTLPLLTQS